MPIQFPKDSYNTPGVNSPPSSKQSNRTEEKANATFGDAFGSQGAKSKGTSQVNSKYFAAYAGHVASQFPLSEFIIKAVQKVKITVSSGVHNLNYLISKQKISNGGAAPLKVDEEKPITINISQYKDLIKKNLNELTRNNKESIKRLHVLVEHAGKAIGNSNLPDSEKTLLALQFFSDLQVTLHEYASIQEKTILQDRLENIRHFLEPMKEEFYFGENIQVEQVREKFIADPQHMSHL